MHRAWLLGIALASAAAFAQPAAVQHVDGSAALSVQGDPEWIPVQRGRKLRAGDRLWTDRGSRAEVQAGRHVLYLDGQSELRVDELRPGALRASVRRGTAAAQVTAIGAQENFELDTPNLALRARAPGRFRVDVDVQRGVTQVSVLDGEATVFGAKGESKVLRAAERATFAGRALGRAAAVRAAADDAFERWVDARPAAAAQIQRDAQSRAQLQRRRDEQARREQARRAQAQQWEREQEDWLRYQNGLPPAWRPQRDNASRSTG